MAAFAPLQIQGVEMAFERVMLSGAGAEPRPLVVQRIRARDAAPLMKMLEVAAVAAQAAGRGTWVLQNIDSVRAMASAAQILKFMEAPILLQLHQYPTRNSILSAFALFAGSLREAAPVAGGTFQVVLNGAAASVDNYIVEARAQPKTPYGKLRERIEELKDLFRSIADTAYTLRHN